MDRGTLADYFVSMLCDVDRAKRFEAAIRAVIREWFEDHVGQSQRTPIVMDVGCGTGAYVAGAQGGRASDGGGDGREENGETIDIMEECMARAAEADHTLKGRYEVVRGRTSGVVQGLRHRCDIVVSEILGSFISSEEAFKFLPSIVREGLRPADSDKLYMVPKRCIQSARLYRFDSSAFTPSEYYALQKILGDAAEPSGADTGVSALGIQLDAFDHERLCTSVLRVESTSRRAVAGGGSCLTRCRSWFKRRRARARWWIGRRPHGLLYAAGVQDGGAAQFQGNGTGGGRRSMTARSSSS